MAEFWGTALDGELAYRHDRMTTALQRPESGRTGSPAADGSAASRAARAPADQCGAWVAPARIRSMARGSMSTPFVARAPQVDQLTLALRRADAGEPTAVLLAADAGVGKTRLLRHVAELAEAAGARVVVAHCVDLGEIGLPYLPFAEALPSCARWTPTRSTRSSPTGPPSPACCRRPPGSARPAGRPVEPAAAVRRPGRGARRGRRARAPAAARPRGPALGRRVQPGRAALPGVAAARPAPAGRRQLPHRRPAPAAPVAARSPRSWPGTRASSGWTSPRSPDDELREFTTALAGRPAGGAHAAAGHRPLRGQRLLRRGAARGGDRRPTSCRGRSPTSCAPGSSSSTRRCSALARIASAAGRRVSEPLLRARSPRTATRCCRRPARSTRRCARPSRTTSSAARTRGSRSGTRCWPRPSTPTCCPASSRPPAPRLPAGAARRPGARPVVAARLARAARARPADRAARLAGGGAPGARGARAGRGAAPPGGGAAAVGRGARGHGERSARTTPTS